MHSVTLLHATLYSVCGLYLMNIFPTVLCYHFRAGVKGMIVLLPLLGLTWVFGIMAINKDTIAFQYLFAILNSLQVTRFTLLSVCSRWLLCIRVVRK